MKTIRVDDINKLLAGKDAKIVRLIKERDEAREHICDICFQGDCADCEWNFCGEKNEGKS